MKTIRHIATLFYYGGVQIFEACDAIGGHYIAVMVEPADGFDRYFLAGACGRTPGRFDRGSSVRPTTPHHPFSPGQPGGTRGLP